MSDVQDMVPIAQESHELVPQALYSARIDLSCRLPHAELTRLYRMIETALPQTPHRIVQFVSAYEGEGAAEIAFETAVITARLIGKRVLYIDTSPAQSLSYRRFPHTLGTPLETLLLTARPPHEAIVQVEGTDLYFAMLHGQGEDGMSQVSLSAIEKTLSHLRLGFDLIVLDSQAVLTEAFGMALAGLVDGSVLVVEAEGTRAPVALECRRLIEAGGGYVIGSVLNRRRLYIPKALYRLLYRHVPL